VVSEIWAGLCQSTGPSTNIRVTSRKVATFL